MAYLVDGHVAAFREHLRRHDDGFACPGALCNDGGEIAVFVVGNTAYPIAFDDHPVIFRKKIGKKLRPKPGRQLNKQPHWG